MPQAKRTCLSMPFQLFGCGWDNNIFCLFSETAGTNHGSEREAGHVLRLQQWLLCIAGHPQVYEVQLDGLLQALRRILKQVCRMPWHNMRHPKHSLACWQVGIHLQVDSSVIWFNMLK